MSRDELHEAINAVIIDQTWVTYERVGQDAVVAGSGLAADAILALPEMQAMLAKDADIERLTAEVERLRAERKAIEALHQPMGKPAACCTCWKSWPCRTHLLLHPEEARRG